MQRLPLLLLALLAVVRPADAEDLSVVSYNVHGLPSWIAMDDPAARMPVIGKLLSRYDVALVQEVWGYDDALSENVRFSARVPGNGPRAAWLEGLSWFCGPCGSGLLVFGRLPQERVLESTAVGYEVCNDYWISGNDCFATKGFIHARLRLDFGAEIDVVDTHLESGRSDADFAVRAAQLAALQRFLEARSAGRALVLGGDLNLEREDPRERALVLSFAEALGLTDTGARASADGRFSERLDWILFREGGGVALEVLESGEDRSFEWKGEPLSDHPAVFARFRVTRAE